MGNWFKQFEALIWAATIALACLMFMFQAFATKEYVELKHENVIDILSEIRTDIREIKNRELGRK